MEKQYTTHLCTFMGRQGNVEILIRYIEQALKIGAVDNYWMIDMTRNVRDHEYIFSEQQRLDSIYPGRVHLYNRETRAKELEDPVAISRGVGSWKTFYKFLERFTDNDIIAKCDDDTMYIDVETLRSAFDFRWNNKQPYLMHANCINNGITAYHQHKKGIWNTEETKVYPACGLTGPLFSFPEIACEHHIQFTNDLKQDINNIDNYKLKENILFTQRVSINFIFMLGADRHSLSTIDLQDEYETSSKKPQAEDRPNCIIGDFTIAHHTYGVQEPVMEQLNTLSHYRELVDIYDQKELQNKQITCGLNKVTTLKSGSRYVVKHPATNKSVKIKHLPTGKWIGITAEKKQKIDFDENRNKIETGRYMLQNKYTLTDEEASASIFEIDLDKPTLFEFNNSNKIIRTGGSRKEIEANIKPQKPSYPGHMIAKFFQGGYKTETVEFIKTDSGNYSIRSNTNKDFWLNIQHNKKNGNTILRWDKDVPCEYHVEDIHSRDNTIHVATVKRCDDNIMNDGSYYELLTDNEVIYKPREYYWMIDHYIWELIEHEEGYYVKLVADNLTDRYLAVENKLINTSTVPYKWILVDKMLKAGNGEYLNIGNTVTLSPTGTKIL